MAYCFLKWSIVEKNSFEFKNMRKKSCGKISTVPNAKIPGFSM